MRSLSDTIGRISAFRAMSLATEGVSGDDRLSDLTDFGANPGALRGRFYVPGRLRQGAPLVVVLHGCTQTAAGYDQGSGWSRLADEEGFALLFPEQQRANNVNLCFNWFVPEDVKRGSGEALSIRGMIAAMVAVHGIDPRRVFVTGLSAGGAMASAMLATYPEVFAGGAIIAGLAYGAASSVPEAFDRMRGHGLPTEKQLVARLRGASRHAGPWPTVSVWQGTADRTVDPANARAILAQWLGVHGLDAEPTRTEQVDGHQRQVWCDADGRAAVEAYAVAGMGHGTPLDTKGADGLGVAQPFMLDVGLSSTRRIAGFWGLAGVAKARAEAGASAKPASARPARTEAEPSKPEPAKLARPHDRGPSHGAAKAGAAARPGNAVRKVIEDALRAAGLIR